MPSKKDPADGRTWQSKKSDPPRLLRMVNHKPHARPCDHDEDALPTATPKRAEPATDDEPQSSSDELADSSPAVVNHNPRVRHLSKERQTSVDSSRVQAMSIDGTGSSAGDNFEPPTESQSSAGGKRKRKDAKKPETIVEMDEFEFDFEPRRRRQTLTYNIHAKATFQKPKMQVKEPKATPKGPQFVPPRQLGEGSQVLPNGTGKAFTKPRPAPSWNGGAGRAKTTKKFKVPFAASSNTPLRSPQRNTRSKAVPKPAGKTAAPEFPAPAFKQPRLLDKPTSALSTADFTDPFASIASSGSSSSLSSPPSSDDIALSGSTCEGLPDISFEEAPSVCPMCRVPVPVSLLYEYVARNPRMSVRDQSAFCRLHHHKSAEDTWTNRRYPVIDWDGLDVRLQSFHHRMEEVLSGRAESLFRDRLEERVKGGRQRTLLQSLEAGAGAGMAPGYYGARGSRLMTDHIISHFSSNLRSLAASDRVIAFGGGVAGYIQAVLVPELATLLVQEDMKVDAARAREILEESREVGELLSEDVEDKITVGRRKDVVIIEDG